MVPWVLRYITCPFGTDMNEVQESYDGPDEVQGQFSQRRLLKESSLGTDDKAISSFGRLRHRKFSQ